MRKFVILVQGQSNNVELQKERWVGFDVIFSTWKGCETLYSNGDVVLFNEKPSDSGPANINYQTISTTNGLQLAKEMGYTHLLKIRDDIVPSNSTNFCKLLDLDKLNFLAWHRHEVYPNCPGYLVDFLMGGPIDSMIDLWNIQSNFCNVPEIILTWNYIQKCNKIGINYLLNGINSDTNELHWVKNGINISNYKALEINDERGNFIYTDSIEFLNNNYIDFLK